MSGRQPSIPPRDTMNTWSFRSGLPTPLLSSRAWSIAYWETWLTGLSSCTSMIFSSFLRPFRYTLSTCAKSSNGCWRTSFCQAEKCEFHAKSVSFLGFIVSAGEIKPDPAKVEAVAKWPVPDTRKALQRFLGFANFYRRFIRNFGQVAAPLTALTSIKVPFTWSAQAQEAFDKLKSWFISAPVSPFQIPNGNLLLRWTPLMSG